MKAIRGNGSKLGKLCLIAGGMLSAGHVAQAQTAVQVYGLVDSYIGSIKRSDQPMATSVVNGGGTATSFWGVRGTEDLGGGMKAIFVLESFFQSDTGAQGRNTSDPLFSKDSYVGLNGKYGQITMGRHTIPLFSALVADNPFGGSLQFSPLMLQSWLPTYGRTVAADSKWDNSVQYTTPDLAGFKTTIIGGAGEAAGHNGTGNIGLSTAYVNGPLTATLVGQRTKVGVGLAPATPMQSVIMGGATYTFSLLKLYGTYYQTQIPVSEIHNKTAQLGVTVPFGANKISASLVRSMTTARTTTAGRTGFAAGFEHAMSKTTALYGIYGYDKLTTNGSAGSVGVGIRHVF